MNIKKTIYIISAIWLLIISVWTIKNEIILANGREVILETVPVDPRDIVMGDYVILNYEITDILKRNDDYKIGDTVIVKLFPNDENIATYFRIDKKRKPSDLIIKGKVVNCRAVNIWTFSKRKCVKYGIENFYVKEGTGLELQKKLRNGGLVKVSIDKHGNAKIKGFVEK